MPARSAWGRTIGRTACLRCLGAVWIWFAACNGVAGADACIRVTRLGTSAGMGRTGAFRKQNPMILVVDRCRFSVAFRSMVERSARFTAHLRLNRHKFGLVVDGRFLDCEAG